MRLIAVSASEVIRVVIVVTPQLFSSCISFLSAAWNVGIDGYGYGSASYCITPTATSRR